MNTERLLSFDDVAAIPTEALDQADLAQLRAAYHAAYDRALKTPAHGAATGAWNWIGQAVAVASKRGENYQRDVVSERVAGKRDLARLFVFGTRHMQALGAASHRAPNYWPQLGPLPRPEPEHPFQPRGEALPVRAWCAHRTAALLDPTRTRIVDGKLHVRGFNGDDLAILRKHAGEVRAWIEAQFEDVESASVVLSFNAAA